MNALIQMSSGAAFAGALFWGYKTLTAMPENTQYAQLKTTYTFLTKSDSIDSVLGVLIYRTRFPVEVDALLAGCNKAAYMYLRHVEEIHCGSQVYTYAGRCVAQSAYVLKRLEALQKMCLNSGVSDDDFNQVAFPVIDMLKNWQHNLAVM